MAVDAEKNAAQAVEKAEVNSDEGRRVSSDWQAIGEEAKMTWKTWVVIVVCLMLPYSQRQH
jgi:hypothetical protein